MEIDRPTAADYARADIDAAQGHNRDLSARLRKSEKERKLAEWKLECLGYLAQGIIEADLAARYGHDINSILEFTQEDMDRYLMEGWHD